ncbi:lactate utilization protein [Sporomusa sphaeroides]|uniref:lactate utilization protein n=1 Tax=Sporomusa sphaeroides TaxID=47679 RepID=UPI002B8C03E9|nr:lactate utilization protein [Sporomusa sphaeroides]HML33583.1 lactate utilization protein [Sporomusa sphaeroides]
MSEFTNWHNQTIGEKLVKALEKNNFIASYVNTRQEALDKLAALIPADATVGIGGSWTIKEVGIDTLLEERGNTVFNHNKPGLSKEESMALRRKQMTCDIFLTGTNALTLQGELVNVDGSGNRAAAMIFGPKKVIVIIGINKVVTNTDAAMERIELYAAPINNKRIGLPNPCTTTGQCMDCQGPTRICNVTTIMHKKPLGTEVEIIIIGEELGF